MSNYFSIKIKQTQAMVGDLEKCIKVLEQCIDDTCGVNRNISGYQYWGIEKRIGKAINVLNEEKNKTTKYKEILEQVIERYQQTENSILGNANEDKVLINNANSSEASSFGEGLWDVIKNFLGINKRVNEETIDSIVFDDDGQYGGDQGSPQYVSSWFGQKKDLYKTVRKYYPNMTDKEIKEFLKQLNHEGCGYVAIVNSIFDTYVGREKEFEETFGFSMYYKNDLNYDRLLVDMYTATDNREKDGTNYYDRQEIVKQYLGDKGIDVEIELTEDITPDNLLEKEKEGNVVIQYFYGNLYNEDGTVAQYIDGGHAMTITGVADDGRYIVSSWGNKYYLNPDEIIEKDENKTNFWYEQYKYIN